MTGQNALMPYKDVDGKVTDMWLSCRRLAVVATVNMYTRCALPPSPSLMGGQINKLGLC